MGGSVWHPNTQMSEWDAFDEIVSAKGMYLFDSSGRRLLDGVASMWCNVWGHSRQELVRAIQRQAQNLQHSPLFNLTHGPAEQLAGRLVRTCPGMSRVFYSDNGSSAMEVSVKMAIQYWKNLGEDRTRIMSLQNGYHGDTFGAMSIGYSAEFFSRYREKLFECVQMPVPHRYRIPSGFGPEEYQSYCLDRIEDTMKEDDGVAALVMESGAQVAGGAVIYPRGFQEGISRLCREYGVLLVADEVATGLGRLGSMAEYAAQRSAPDIVSFGKMLTGGYLTLAATLATEKVYDSFLGEYDDCRHLFHGHTYTGNPIASAVALENLEMYERYGLIGQIRETSRVFEESRDRIESQEMVGDVRHSGMLMGIELVSDRESKTPVTASGSLNRILFEAARENGIYLRTLGNIILLVPPLAISEEELADLIDGTVRTIESVRGIVR